MADIAGRTDLEDIPKSVVADRATITKAVATGSDFIAKEDNSTTVVARHTLDKPSAVAISRSAPWVVAASELARVCSCYAMVAD